MTKKEEAMKRLIGVLIGIFLGFGFAFASDVKPSDLNFAFSGVKSSEIVILSKTEMKKVKGAGWFKHFRHSIRHLGHYIRKRIRRIPRWRRYRMALQAIGVIGAIYTGGTIYPTFQGFAFSVAW
jgi:hypothetical protein